MSFPKRAVATLAMLGWSGAATKKVKIEGDGRRPLLASEAVKPKNSPAWRDRPLS